MSTLFRKALPTMLIACSGCRHQYDVGGLVPGTRLHCRCGDLVTVPEPKSEEMRAVHCSQCGANLDVGAQGCGYCGSSFSMTERRLGQACPQCFSRTLDGASFCSTCGVGLDPEAIELSPMDADCPRCEGALARRSVQQGSFVECTDCGGIWLSEKSFEDVVDRGDQSSVAPFLGKNPDEEECEVLAAETRENELRYLPCPECGHFMNRKNFAQCSGVVIDWCKGHGYWFDTCELDKILAFVRSGGMDRARRIDIDRQKRSKTMDLAGWAPTSGQVTATDFKGWDSEPATIFDTLASVARFIFNR